MTIPVVCPKCGSPGIRVQMLAWMVYRGGKMEGLIIGDYEGAPDGIIRCDDDSCDWQLPERLPARITLDAAERVQLRLAGRKRGLKHKDIARQIGVDPRTLAKYACGERRPTTAVLQAWQRVLGIRERID